MPRRVVSRADTRRRTRAMGSVAIAAEAFDRSTRLGLRADRAAANGKPSKARRLRLEARTAGRARG